jgi:hypothetical protein
MLSLILIYTQTVMKDIHVPTTQATLLPRIKERPPSPRLVLKTAQRLYSFLQLLNASNLRTTARLALLSSTRAEDSPSLVRGSLVAALAHESFPGANSTASAGVRPFGCCTSQCPSTRTDRSGSIPSVTGCADVCSHGMLGIGRAGGGSENPSSISACGHGSACMRGLEGCWTTGGCGLVASLLKSPLQYSSPLGALGPGPP